MKDFCSGPARPYFGVQRASAVICSLKKVSDNQGFLLPYLHSPLYRFFFLVFSVGSHTLFFDRRNRQLNLLQTILMPFGRDRSSGMLLSRIRSATVFFGPLNRRREALLRLRLFGPLFSSQCGEDSSSGVSLHGS